MLAIHQQKTALDPVVHSRLIADLQSVCETANVPSQYVEESAVPYVSKGVLQWLKDFPVHRKAGRGLLLTGVQPIAPEKQMLAICGALLRNFIDARVMLLHRLIDDAKEGHSANPSVLLIPNLHLKTVGKALPDWQVQYVYDLLLSRRVQGKLTCAYVEDLKSLEAIYGAAFSRHLQDNFKLV